VSTQLTAQLTYPLPPPQALGQFVAALAGGGGVVVAGAAVEALQLAEPPAPAPGPAPDPKSGPKDAGGGGGGGAALPVITRVADNEIDKAMTPTVIGIGFAAVFGALTTCLTMWAFVKLRMRKSAKVSTEPPPNSALLRQAGIRPPQHRTTGALPKLNGATRRGLYCHSALSRAVSIGIVHIKENGRRKNDLTAHG
jgi:hypothetical protein